MKSRLQSHPALAPVSRRRFLKSAGAAALAAPFIASGLRAASPNGRLQHASFGASGMAGADIQSLAASPHLELVAVADVDRRRLDEIKKKFPDVRAYQDWRELLAAEGDRLDTVNVSTPDHMHGPIGLAAMEHGLHVYGQKPLAQNLRETRLLASKAAEKDLMSQMGIQISSGFTERLAVQLVHDGAIGKVREVHTFSSKKWGDPNPLPDREDPVPDGLHWDWWLGVAAERPYIEGEYHPGAWRRRRDFGTGTLGDMGCHIFSGWYRALKLGAPTAVKSTGPAPNKDSWAINARIEYTFPGTDLTERDSVKVTWTDGDERPPAEIAALVEDKLPDQGSVMIGTEGVLLLPHVSTPRLFPSEKFKGFRYPKLEPRDHYLEFVDKVRAGDSSDKPSAAFDTYSGPLTEAVLLGCVASVFKDRELAWNAENLAFPDSPEATALVTRVYRKGWEV